MPELREEDGSHPKIRRRSPRRLPGLRRGGQEAHLFAGLPVQGDRLVRHRLRRQEGRRSPRIEVQIGGQERRGRRQGREVRQGGFLGFRREQRREGGEGREERKIRRGGIEELR